MYYRDADKFEVDFVIENTQERLVCFEVKASATVNQKDL
jgi:predicted AAA+ superfamily ATPase